MFAVSGQSLFVSCATKSIFASWPVQNLFQRSLGQEVCWIVCVLPYHPPSVGGLVKSLVRTGAWYHETSSMCLSTVFTLDKDLYISLHLKDVSYDLGCLRWLENHIRKILFYACLFLPFSLDMHHCQELEKENTGRHAFALSGYGYSYLMTSRVLAVHMNSLLSAVFFFFNSWDSALLSHFFVLEQWLLQVELDLICSCYSFESIQNASRLKRQLTSLPKLWGKIKNQYV